MAEYNEDAYKLARKTYIQHSCPFERALLSRCVGCGRSLKLNLAEREAIACGDSVVREHCLAFYQALHENAQFALKINPAASRPLPNTGGTTSHSTRPASGQVAGYPPQAGEGANVTPKSALRFPHPNPPPQAGEGANVTPKSINAPWPFGKEIRAQCGGVRGLASALNTAGDETTDIAETVLAGVQSLGSCDAFPYSEIMRAVVHYEPRKRRS
jgi:hypothetical protein